MFSTSAALHQYYFYFADKNINTISIAMTLIKQRQSTLSDNSNQLTSNV